RLRPAPRLLLQRPQQRLPGGREVPRRPADVGRVHGRALRGQGAQLAQDPLPHADGRGDADRPAGRQQHRPRRAAGLRRGVRRHAVPAHQRLRRGARAALRARGEDRPAHAADHRPRVGRDRHGRPLRGLVLRRGAHGGDRVARADPHRPHRRDGRLGQRHRLHDERDRRVGLGLPGALPHGPGHRRRRQQVRRGRARDRGHPARRPGVRAGAARPAEGLQGEPRPGARAAPARGGPRGRPRHGQPAARPARGPARPLLARRGLLRDARRVRALPAGGV
ncbi:MAG: Methylmalonyl-CoA mutase, partial [uncultured Solirubrobacteraceae bacterium]